MSSDTVRTWYYDDDRTHGEAGLACVDTEAHANMAGMLPDETFTGTAAELAAHLREEGITEVERVTDGGGEVLDAMDELYQAWTQPAWDEHMTGYHHVPPYALQHARNTGATSSYVHWVRYNSCDWSPEHGDDSHPHRWSLTSSEPGPAASYGCRICPAVTTGSQIR